MGKKNDNDKLGEIVDELIADVGDDRNRLTLFIDKLLEEHGDQPAGIAEYIAKLIDAATRQHQVKVSMVKALAKKPSDVAADESSEMDEIHKQIGLPFEDEDQEEDSN